MRKIVIPDDESMTFPNIDWRETFVLELGNKRNDKGTYRSWYEVQGADYECVDWNGQDGAHEINMGSPLNEPYWEWSPDIVTNFGFTEHVCSDGSAQEQCWFNLHQWLRKVGSRLCFVMPYPGHWDHHGVYQPTTEWYKTFAKLNGYEIEYLVVNNNRQRFTICGRLRRLNTDKVFTMPSPDLVYITPPKRRVNKSEKECGIEPT